MPLAQENPLLTTMCNALSPLITPCAPYAGAVRTDIAHNGS
ncbi:hypothetical protein [Undibacterium hunanense]|nr:hypothetical protein [Undibacterium hunanense]